MPPRRARRALVAVVLLGSGAVAAMGSAVPSASASSGGLGGLDQSFGTNGVASITGGGDLVATTTDASGNVVGAGYVSVNNTDELAVARFTGAGVPDAAFAAGGFAHLSISSQAESVAVDPSGTVFAAGYQIASSGASVPLVVRYTPGAGTFDPTFDPAAQAVLNGSTLGTFTPGSASAGAYVASSAVAVVPPGLPNAGGVVVAWQIAGSGSGSQNALVVFGFTPAGGLAWSYKSPTVGCTLGDSVGGIALDPATGDVYVSGTTAVAGCAATTSASKGYVLALGSPSGTTGSLVPGFGSSGIAYLTQAAASVAGGGITLSDSGATPPTLAIAGTVTASGASSAALFGLNGAGGQAFAPAAAPALTSGLDATFVGNTGAPTGVFLGGQASGVAYAGIELFDLGASPPTADPNFGSGGVSTSVPCVTSGHHCGGSIAVQADENLLVAGYVAGSTQNAPSVARVLNRAISVAGPGTVAVGGPGLTADFPVSVSSLGSSSVTVGFATQDGTAKAGTNYSAMSNTITFPCSSSEPAGVSCSGTTTAVVAVPLLAGGSGSLTFSLDLANPSGAGLGAASANATLAYPAASSSGGGTPTPPPTTIPPTTTTLPPAPVTKPATPGKGYWVVAANGRVFAFGSATNFGSVPKKSLQGPIVGIAPTPNGAGYWVAAAKGAVYAFGNAHRFGSVPKKRLAGVIRSISPTANGRGYWLASSAGRVYGFGNARVFGQVPKKRLAGPITGLATTSNAKGYWLVSARGVVYGFGNARGHGSVPRKKLRGTVTGFARTSNNGGYWLVSSTGIVYAFGNAHNYGSVPAKKRTGTITGITRMPDNKGYWLVSSKGTIYRFGSARLYGSAAGKAGAATAGVAAT